MLNEYTKLNISICFYFSYSYTKLNVRNLCKVFDKREITLLMCVLRCTENEFKYKWCCCDIAWNCFYENGDS
jgi:hypothetical protein